MRQKIMMLLIVLGLLVVVNSGDAAILHDDFEGTTLDPAWTFSNANVDSYTYDVSGSEFGLTGMTYAADAEWTNLYVGQSIDSTDDFHLDFIQTWNQDDVDDNPWAKLWLYSEGALVGYFGIEDYGGGEHGYGTSSIYTSADGNVIVGDSLATSSGTLDWDVDRTGGEMTISLDGNEMTTLTDARPIDEVFMTFQAKYMYLDSVGFDWSNGSPTMGVDLINVVPEPATIALLACGGILLRRKR
jgi:hypothetical protein